MLRIMKGKMFKLGMLGTSALFMAAPSFASRVIQSQGTYMKTSGDLWIIAFKAFMFLAGLAAIAFASWHFLQDYVLAKSDHEKKFSAGKLIAGAVVGSFMLYPGGAALIGGDVTGAGVEAAVNQSDFTQSTAGGGS